MKKNREVIRQIIIIVVLGLALTLFRGEYSWGFSLDSLKSADLETTLNYLNLILPFLALALGVGVFIYLRFRENPRHRSGKEELSEKNGEEW